MNTSSGHHGQDHSEWVGLYVLDSLPATEIPVVAAQIAACADCRQEVETLRPIVDALSSWPLWERLTRRIGVEPGRSRARFTTPRQAESEWRDVAPGIACKLLATDEERNRVSMLVRLAPGTDYPAHRHAGVEELYLLRGELIVDDRTYYPGDYRRAEAGSVDHRVWSETGCTCVLITSFRDAIL
jgi:anti-sigma factor ChrR (cupin superfamily)